MIEPAYLWVPPRVGSYGDEAVDLARMAGRELDAEQCLSVDAHLSYGPGGRWVALETVTIKPRQTGKTGGELLPVTLFDLFLLPPDRIVWTAHLFRTARDAFNDFCACIEHSPELSRRTRHISYGHGEEYIETTAGARLEFLARSKGGGRGLGGKRVVMDEALILPASTMGSLMPVLSARPDPQINYGSSAAKEDSDQLHALILRGRRGGDPSLIYVEHCAPGGWTAPVCAAGRGCIHTVGTDGCALDDESLWPLANHTIGDRITFEYVRAERRALPPREFGRERLGWHEEPVGSGYVIDLGLWQRRCDPRSEVSGRSAMALDASPERTSAAIGMTGRRSDGALHRQLLEHRPGMDWLLPSALELDAAVDNYGWSVDPSSPAGALIPEMMRFGLTVHQVVGREMTQACTAMLNGAVDDSGWHLGQPAVEQAWRDARTATYGDTERFTRRRSSGDICPVMVLTLSDHGFRVHGDRSYNLLESVR